MASASVYAHSEFNFTNLQNGSSERQEHADSDETDQQPAENSSIQHKLSQHEPQPEASSGADSHADRASVISYDRNFLLSLRFSSLSTAPPQKLLEDGSFPAEILYMTQMQEYVVNDGTSSNTAAATFTPSSGYVKQSVKKSVKSIKAVRVRSSSTSSADGCTQTESQKCEKEPQEQAGNCSISSPYTHSANDDINRSLALRELQRSENAHALVTYLVLSALRRSAQEQVLVERLLAELVHSCVVLPEWHQKGFLEAALIVLNTAASNPATWARFAVLLAATVPHDVRLQWRQQKELADVAASVEAQENCNSAVDVNCDLREAHASDDDCEVNRCNDAGSTHVHLAKADVMLNGNESVMRSSPSVIDGQLLESSKRDVNGEKSVSSQQSNQQDAHHQRLTQTEQPCSVDEAVLSKQSFREPTDEARPLAAALQSSEKFQGRATPTQRQNVANRLLKQFHLKS